MPSPSDIPQNFTIATPINRAAGNAPAIGIGTGFGGAVTQATSKSTGVTLNKKSGVITMNAALLATVTDVSFTFTNSEIGATDVVICNQGSGGTSGAYFCRCITVAAGSCVIRVLNTTGGSLSEALTINFVVVDAVNS